MGCSHLKSQRQQILKVLYFFHRVRTVTDVDPAKQWWEHTLWDLKRLCLAAQASELMKPYHILKQTACYISTSLQSKANCNGCQDAHHRQTKTHCQGSWNNSHTLNTEPLIWNPVIRSDLLITAQLCQSFLTAFSLFRSCWIPVTANDVLPVWLMLSERPSLS